MALMQHEGNCWNEALTGGRWRRKEEEERGLEGEGEGGAERGEAERGREGGGGVRRGRGNKGGGGKGEQKKTVSFHFTLGRTGSTHHSLYST